ncbi:MAG: response regulator transcription factor [Pseudomonadales bacterium]|jgi:two-component system OmpR family response regulator
MHILLIEDDRDTAAFTADGLRRQGHVVDVTENGVDGLHMALEGAPDLVIVDRMVPGLDGVSVVRALRAADRSVPVLFLTAMGSVEDRVAGLDAGGDDYLAKPFAFSELIARVNALARRPPMREARTTIEIGNLRLERLRRRVTAAGREIALQAREYQLLDYLIEHAGQIVTRTMLLEGLWGFHFDPGTNIVETHISRLRTKLDRGGATPVIRTVRGVGYTIDDDG